MTKGSLRTPSSSRENVIPAEAGIQEGRGPNRDALDSRLRGNDGGKHWIPASAGMTTWAYPR